MYTHMHMTLYIRETKATEETTKMIQVQTQSRREEPPRFLGVVLVAIGDHLRDHRSTNPRGRAPPVLITPT